MLWARRLALFLCLSLVLGYLGVAGGGSGRTDVRGYFEILVAPGKAITGTVRDCRTYAPLAFKRVTVSYHGTLDRGTRVEVSISGYQSARFPVKTLASSWIPGVGSYTTYNLEEICLQPQTGGGPTPPPTGRVYALIHVPALRVIKVIDVAAASVTNEIQLPIVTTGPLPIAVSPDGRYGMVHLASQGYVWVFEIPSGREAARLPDFGVRTVPLEVPEESPGSMLFTPDGKYALAQLVGTGYQPVLQIHDLAAGTTRTVPLNIATTSPIPIVVTQNGRYALFCGYCTRCRETELKVMDLATGDIVSSALLGIYLQVSLPFVVTSDGRYVLVHVPNRGVVVILDVPAVQKREVPLTDQAGNPVILADPLPLVLAEQ